MVFQRVAQLREPRFRALQRCVYTAFPASRDDFDCAGRL